MRQRDADIANHGAIRQVALQSTHRKFIRHVNIHGVCNPQIPLSILKIYRVDLMRHCGRPHLPLHYNLSEVPHRDVGPHIPAKVYQNRIYATHIVKYCR